MSIKCQNCFTFHLFYLGPFESQLQPCLVANLCTVLLTELFSQKKLNVNTFSFNFTCDCRTKIPWLSSHVKYVLPWTVPLFLPFGSSSITPIHLPWTKTKTKSFISHDNLSLKTVRPLFSKKQKMTYVLTQVIINLNDTWWKLL